MTRNGHVSPASQEDIPDKIREVPGLTVSTCRALSPQSSPIPTPSGTPPRSPKVARLSPPCSTPEQIQVPEDFTPVAKDPKVEATSEDPADKAESEQAKASQLPDAVRSPEVARAPMLAQHGSFSRGELVTISGLTGRPELNQATGTLLRFDAALGRW